MPNRIPLDPVLPKNFDCTPNRSLQLIQLSGVPGTGGMAVCSRTSLGAIGPAAN